LLAQLPSAKAHAAAAAASQRSLRSHPLIEILLERFIATAAELHPPPYPVLWQPRRYPVLPPDLATRVTETDPEEQEDAYTGVLRAGPFQFVSHPPLPP
jgi:hypothetical protein